MRAVALGNTGLNVSRLAFGTVYLGPDGDALLPTVAYLMAHDPDLADDLTPEELLKVARSLY